MFFVFGLQHRPKVSFYYREQKIYRRRWLEKCIINVFSRDRRLFKTIKKDNFNYNRVSIEFTNRFDDQIHRDIWTDVKIFLNTYVTGWSVPAIRFPRTAPRTSYYYSLIFVRISWRAHTFFFTKIFSRPLLRVRSLWKTSRPLEIFVKTIEIQKRSDRPIEGTACSDNTTRIFSRKSVLFSRY